MDVTIEAVGLLGPDGRRLAVGEPRGTPASGETLRAREGAWFWVEPAEVARAIATGGYAAAVELREEFGITVEVGEFVASSIYGYERGAIELLAFRVAHVRGEFTLLGHDELRCVLPQQLDAFDFAPADLPIVRQLVASA